MRYINLFAPILDSAIWLEPQPTRLVWIALLGMADRKGIVSSSLPGLARRAGVSMEECQTALRRILSPDPHSGMGDHDGSHAIEIAGGWMINGYDGHRSRALQAKRLAENAVSQERWRQRHGRKPGRAKAPSENEA